MKFAGRKCPFIVPILVFIVCSTFVPIIVCVNRDSIYSSQHEDSCSTEQCPNEVKDGMYDTKSEGEGVYFKNPDSELIDDVNVFKDYIYDIESEEEESYFKNQGNEIIDDVNVFKDDMFDTKSEEDGSYFKNLVNERIHDDEDFCSTEHCPNAVKDGMYDTKSEEEESYFKSSNNEQIDDTYNTKSEEGGSYFKITTNEQIDDVYVTKSEEGGSYFKSSNNEQIDDTYYTESEEQGEEEGYFKDDEEIDDVNIGFKRYSDVFDAHENSEGSGEEFSWRDRDLLSVEDEDLLSVEDEESPLFGGVGEDTFFTNSSDPEHSMKISFSTSIVQNGK